MSSSDVIAVTPVEFATVIVVDFESSGELITRGDVIIPDGVDAGR
jgi:hypothetical protein